jgi:hypothetical protein
VSPGIATCVTEVQRGKEIVMLFEDGRGNRQTTDLLTVKGDSSSSVGCLNKQSLDSKDNITKHQTLPKGAIIGIVAASVGIVGGIATLMAIYVCRRKRVRTSQQPSPKIVLPAVSRAPIPSPGYVSGITLFGTTGVPSPVSPNFGYRGNNRGNEQTPWVRPERPASLFGSRWTEVYRESTHSSSNITYPSTKPREQLDIDLMPDMVTIYSLHSIDSGSVAPSAFAQVPNHSYSRRATPDVPVGAERLSMFDSSSTDAGSEYLERTSIQSSISNGGVSAIAESGCRILMEPFVADEWEEGTSPDVADSVQISAATRVRRTVASAARMGSESVLDGPTM